MNRSTQNAPVDMINLSRLLDILTALDAARPDLAEGFYLVAQASGLGDCFEPDLVDSPVIFVEQPYQQLDARSGGGE